MGPHVQWLATWPVLFGLRELMEWRVRWVAALCADAERRLRDVRRLLLCAAVIETSAAGISQSMLAGLSGRSRETLRCLERYG